MWLFFISYYWHNPLKDDIKPCDVFYFERYIRYQASSCNGTMPRKKRDFFYNKAKQMGYRSRAAFKLKFIDEKYHLIKKGDTVVDLGAAPGGWLQVAKELSGGEVIGVDLQKIEPIEGVVTIKGDMTSTETQQKSSRKWRRSTW